MKLTKSELKQLIREAFDEFEKVGSSGARKQAVARTRELAKSGITDTERGLLNTLHKQLIQAAQKGNITTGKALRFAQLLSQELAKIEPEPEHQEEPHEENELRESEIQAPTDTLNKNESK